MVYGLIAYLFLDGCLWIEGWHATAAALLALPVAVYFYGPQLAWAADQVLGRARRAWRTYARAPGKRYCPECAGALAAPKRGRPLGGEECPACEGLWCSSREFLSWLAPYGTSEVTWLPLERDTIAVPLLCPRCAVPLEVGSLERLQPLFARCAACDGHWVERMTWTWFDLTPPKPLPARPVGAREFAVRKDAPSRP